MADAGSAQLPCTASLEAELRVLLVPPKHTEAAKAFANMTALAAVQRPILRRVWNMVVFGFEMDMLRLHMQTLDGAVDGFLVTESTLCFQTRKEKQALLSRALAHGNVLPAHIARKTHVKVVSREEGEASCHGDVVEHKARYSPRCFQNLQRYLLLELLDAHAADDDLAFVADVDEIAAPPAVRLLQACAPFPRWSHAAYATGPPSQRFISQLMLTIRQHKFGAHCDTGDSWSDGPRLYLAGWLRFSRRVGFGAWRNQTARSARARPPASKRAALGGGSGGGHGSGLGGHGGHGSGDGDAGRRLAAQHFADLSVPATRFDGYRTLRETVGKRPTLSRGGWHLTSWGSPTELVRKLTTFGASNLFDPTRSIAHRDALDTRRVDACVRGCYSLLTSDINQKGGIGTPTPCANASAADLRRFRLDGVRRAISGPLTPTSLAKEFGDALPPYLVAHPDQFPASWLVHLHQQPRDALSADTRAREDHCDGRAHSLGLHACSRRASGSTQRQGKAFLRINTRHNITGRT